MLLLHLQEMQKIVNPSLLCDQKTGAKKKKSAINYGQRNDTTYKVSSQPSIHYNQQMVKRTNLRR